MTNTVLRSRLLRGLRLGLAAAVAAALCGCALLRSGPKTPPYDPHATYALAVDSYLAGQYEKAASIFQRLSGGKDDPEIARKAYYGLACSRLVMAKTSKDMHAALSMWNTWVQMTPEGLPGEDPRLLTPLLPRLAPTKATPVAPAAPLLSDEDIKREVAQSKRRAAAGCKEACREETNRLRELLRKKTAETESLRSQLNALERLHQEISIRKRGLE